MENDRLVLDVFLDFLTNWGFLLAVVGVFSMTMVPVFIGCWKAQRKLKQQREDLYWERMRMFFIDELPDNLPMDGDDGLTYEELYHFMKVLYRGSIATQKIAENTISMLTKELYNVRDLQTKLAEQYDKALEKNYEDHITRIAYPKGRKKKKS